MKMIHKTILIFTLSFIFILFMVWFSSIITCEYLTSRYGYQFEELYKENTMIGDVIEFKVLAYYDDYAEVYYVTGNIENGSRSGNVLSFKKEDGKWVYDRWVETVWSNRGSADGYIWPYGR